MDERTVLALRTVSRVCPTLPYAKHTAGIADPLPCSSVDDVDSRGVRSPRHCNGAITASSLTHSTSTVRILSILCSASVRRQCDAVTAPPTPLSSSSSTGTTSAGSAEAKHDHDKAAPSVSRKREREGDEGGDADGDDSEANGEEMRAKKPRCDDPQSGVEDGTESHHQPAPPPPVPSRRGSIYLRVVYDNTLVETLPLELFRERHPQILIDYLLSVGCWV